MKIEIESLDEACDVAFKLVSFLIREEVRKGNHGLNDCDCVLCFSRKHVELAANCLSNSIRLKNGVPK